MIRFTNPPAQNMPFALSSFAFVCTLLSVIAAAAEPPHDAKPDPASQPTKSKFGPKDVEIKLQDGSLFRGEIKDIENLVLKTAYGSLTVPVADLLRIDRGERLADKDLKEIAETIKDLDNDEFAKRSAAQYKLETFPVAAYETVKAARESASPESKNRIDGILKKLAAKSQGKRVQTEDSVRTVRFEATGVLQFDTVKIKSRLGDLAVKLEDIQTVRWLNRGETKNLLLEPTAAMGEWVDTGIDSTPGDRVAVLVTGTINPFNNQDINPLGSSNWGNNNGNQFMMGAVIGKLGGAGEPFLIGFGKVWNTDAKERLFIKINWNFNQTGRSNDAPKGHFNVKIATGSWADEVDASSIQNAGQ